MPAGRASNGASLLLISCIACWALAACDATMPSQRLQNAIHLPVPTAAENPPPSKRLTSNYQRGHFMLSPRTLIPIAFSLNPDIKSSYERFKSEEARYDFFVVSRDSLTPRLRASNDYFESRDEFERTSRGRDTDIVRDRKHSIEVGVEK